MRWGRGLDCRISKEASYGVILGQITFSRMLWSSERDLDWLGWVSGLVV